MQKSIIAGQLSQDFEKAVAAASKMNYDFVEIHSLWNRTVEELSDEEIKRVERILQKYSMGLSCLATTLFLMAPLYSRVDKLERFSDDFPVYLDTYDNHVERFRRCLNISRQLNARFLRIFPFIKEKGVTKDLKEIIEDIAERLQAPLKMAEKAKQEVVIENCPHTYLPKGNLTFKLQQRLSFNHCRLLWDPANSLISAYFQPELPLEYRRLELAREYQQIKNAVAYCHIKDFNRDESQFAFVPLGEGEIDYRELLGNLAAEHFQGFLSLETELEQAGVIKSTDTFQQYLQGN